MESCQVRNKISLLITFITVCSCISQTTVTEIASWCVQTGTVHAWCIFTGSHWKFIHFISTVEIDDDAIWQYTLKPLPLSQLRPENPREQLHWYPEVVSRQFPPFRQFVCPHVTTEKQRFPLVLEITFIGVPLYLVCRIKVWFDTWLCHEWKIYMMHATCIDF